MEWGCACPLWYLSICVQCPHSSMCSRRSCGILGGTDERGEGLVCARIGVPGAPPRLLLYPQLFILARANSPLTLPYQPRSNDVPGPNPAHPSMMDLPQGSAAVGSYGS